MIRAALLLLIVTALNSCGVAREAQILSKGYAADTNGTDFTITLPYRRVQALGGPTSAEVETALAEILAREGYCKGVKYDITRRNAYSAGWDFGGYCD